MTDDYGAGRRTIRITRDDAMSSHVDDLLKRQMSLRGESGITRERARHWYYQNWFVLMIVGMLASILAWGLLEPFLDDTLYIQGPVEELNVSENMPARLEAGEGAVELQVTGQGWARIRGQRVWFLGMATVLRANDARTGTKFDPATLAVGQEIGVYTEFLPLSAADGGGLALARFVVPKPNAPAPWKATLTLRQLHARSESAGLLFFAVVAGLTGLAIGSVDGLICRLPRRALLAGAVGLLAGFIGGFVSGILANLVYAPLSAAAMRQAGDAQGSIPTFAFICQMGARTLGWCFAGMTMGLGQGIALRSKRLLIYGFLGGVIGGILGGLLFDPIDLLLLGMDKPSAHWSRLVGLAVVGASVGAMIGLVELLARDAWLRMVEGPLASKEFLVFKDVMKLGSSPRSDIYLFNDPLVAPHHATLHTIGDNIEIENIDPMNPTEINDRVIHRVRLRHGDRIAIGSTVFVYEQRQH